MKGNNHSLATQTYYYDDLEDACLHSPNFSYGIGKLKGIPVFNLPAIVTCPHRTEACEKYCYAKGGFFVMPRSQRLLDRNLEAAQCACFVDRMIQILDHLTHRKKPITVVRIHSSGDFFDEVYFGYWLEIIDHYPQVTFFFYTRNWEIDCSKLPNNFIPIFSRDHTTKKVNLTIKKHAFVLPIHKEGVKVKHLQKYRAGRICKSNRCDLCGYCWKGKGDVYFPQKFEMHAPIKLELKI